MALPGARCKPVVLNLQRRQKLAVLNPSPAPWVGFKGLRVVQVRGANFEESGWCAVNLPSKRSNGDTSSFISKQEG